MPYQVATGHAFIVIDVAVVVGFLAIEIVAITSIVHETCMVARKERKRIVIGGNTMATMVSDPYDDGRSTRWQETKHDTVETSRAQDVFWSEKERETQTTARKNARCGDGKMEHEFDGGGGVKQSSLVTA
ncbi:uncharacterized protein A4U43_C06F10800 [Asparagus officinalis]|uniref:Transmembrane protein n=1 Tax=Asparagus officinalis TaxID=4686 RepID=A0A5P1ELM1_ASPOF|nr:uncharacterized protein A4U43_C06F10800 [Asparagus officinalis]